MQSLPVRFSTLLAELDTLTDRMAAALERLRHARGILAAEVEADDVPVDAAPCRRLAEEPDRLIATSVSPVAISRSDSSARRRQGAASSSTSSAPTSAARMPRAWRSRSSAAAIRSVSVSSSARRVEDLTGCDCIARLHAAGGRGQGRPRTQRAVGPLPSVAASTRPAIVPEVTATG